MVASGREGDAMNAAHSRDIIHASCNVVCDRQFEWAGSEMTPHVFLWQCSKEPVKRRVCIALGNNLINNEEEKR